MPTIYEAVYAAMDDWKQGGEKNIDRMRESIDQLVENAISEWQVANVDAVTDEETSYEDWATRVDTREQALAVTLIPWIADYPNFQIAWTGGSCRAWRHDLDTEVGSYLLITNEDGTSPEPDKGGKWLCGFYAYEEDTEGTVEELTNLDDVKAWVEAIIGV